MTVDNSSLLQDLLCKLEDKEAASVWGPIAASLKDDDGAPTYWKRDMGDLEGKVTRVFLKDNFEKTGQNPAFDIEHPTHGRVIYELTTKLLKESAARQAVQKGDYIRLSLAQEKTKGKYFNDKLTVVRDGEAEGPGF